MKEDVDRSPWTVNRKMKKLRNGFFMLSSVHGRHSFHVNPHALTGTTKHEKLTVIRCNC